MIRTLLRRASSSAPSASAKRHLQFVFVEGAAATGKSSLCQELHQRGFTVQFENFVELCAKVSWR
jgi:predicted ATPase